MGGLLWGVRGLAALSAVFVLLPGGGGGKGMLLLGTRGAPLA